MSRPEHAAGTARPAAFRDLLRNEEFAALSAADLQSQLGDQLARIALAVLIYARSGSTELTATVFALTFLPAVLAGFGLGHLADLFPRRTVLLACDLSRVPLVALIAVPALPLAAVICLVILAVSVGAVFGAAESASVAEILTGESYAAAAGARIAVLQASQLAGYLVGGLLVASLGTRPALLIDAMTFLVSAAVIRACVEARPAPSDTGIRTSGRRRYGSAVGARAIVRSPALQILLGLSWLSAFTALPEGLAVPYSRALGYGSTAVGLLLAANPAGTLVGTLIFVRLLTAQSRRVLVGPLAVLAGIPLVLCFGQPGLVATVILWVLTGLCGAYHAQIPAEFVQAVPDRGRGQAIAIASSGLNAVQGIGMLLGGVVAQRIGSAHTIAAAGAVLVICSAALAIARQREMAMANA